MNTVYNKCKCGSTNDTNICYGDVDRRAPTVNGDLCTFDFIVVQIISEFIV